MAILGFIALVVVTLYVTFHVAVLSVAASYFGGMGWILVFMCVLAALLWCGVFHFAPFTIMFAGG